MKIRTIAGAPAPRGTSFLSNPVDASRRDNPGLLSLRTIVRSLVACLTIASMCPVNAGAPVPGAGSPVSVQAAGRGWPSLNLRDGYRTSVNYRGDSAYVAMLNTGVARSLALASADFDHNGTPDIVAAYAVGNVGMITVQRGNPDAFAPTDESVFERLQQGYEPDSLLPSADVYPVPVRPDFLVAGDFTPDSAKDILIAAKGGGLYLLKGDGTGKFEAQREIPLPGTVTTLAAGEFRAADGFTDIAVGVTMPGGDALLVFDDAAQGSTDPVVALPLTAPATAVEFGSLDDDPFLDVAVASGSEVLVVHGWGSTEQVDPASRVEHIAAGSSVRGLAIGEFAWNRAGRSAIAALTAEGTVHILRGADLDTRPFTEAEAEGRTRASLATLTRDRVVDTDSVASWKPGSGRWIDANQVTATSFSGVSSVAAKPLLRANVSYRESDDLLLIGESLPKLEFVQQVADMTWTVGSPHASDALPHTALDLQNAPVAVLALPKKLNGVRDFIALDGGSTALTTIPQAPNTTITVDRTDDPSGAALTAASACTGAASDCSLRGALQFANNSLNNNTTISVPAGTYILSINGTGAVGCDGNTVGDLGANQTMTITGAGAATTIIRQTGTGPANDGDRIMCMNEAFTTGLIYSFSGITFVGGRDGTAAGTGSAIGGGGIIGGELNNSLTLTNVVFANNQVTVLGSGNIGGGGVQITGGNLIITNSSFGGASGPGAYTDHTSTNTGNLQAGSGGGVMFTPSSPMHTGGTGNLTVSGSTFAHNNVGSVCCGGGGLDLVIFAFASPGGIGSGVASVGTSTFSNNQATAGNAGAIDVESLPTTITANTSFTSNSATNRGGAIYVGGGSLTLDGTGAAITFSGNTAPNGGTSISTAGPVAVSGTNTSIGGSIEVTTGGTWTMNAGSVLAPTDVVIGGGTFTTNNATVNIGGNLTITPGAIVGSTFNGNTGTINLAGNFVLNAGGSPATTLNAGTGTFNFNGSGAQSISNGTAITFFNLTDSNTTQPLTLNNSLAVNGSLNVNGANAILSPVAGAIISGTGTLTGTGTARASRIAATADFLSQYTLTNKTLTTLTVDYNGAGTQTINNTPSYSNLTISGSGAKTLGGATSITGNLNIAAATFASGNFNFSLGGNWINSSVFTAGTGTVTFAGGSGTQTLSGNTTFNNLTLNNAGATTNFGATTTTIGNDLVASAGTMDGGTSTLIFTGAGDNLGSISGSSAKNFYNLQINSPATISNSSGADITIKNNYVNGGTFVQSAAFTTNSATGTASTHTLSGAGTTTFGNMVINSGNTLDATSHNFNVVGASFNVSGTFSGNTSTVTLNGGVAQSIVGNGAKNFSNLTINNANGVQVVDGTSAVDASVAGLLTLSTDLTVATGAILQQSGTSAGAADVLGTVRRTDLGSTSKAFGNPNNTIAINSGTIPTQLDFNLIKSAPGTFPAAVKVVPRDITLTPTGAGAMSATVALRYIDPGELSGITESRLALWKNVSGTWTPQGGAPDVTNNFVSMSGVSSFSEWAIAEASDLTLTKSNNVSGAAVVGQPWTWTLTAANTGSPATFGAGQTILSDSLPTSGLNYGAVSVQNASNISGSANISCAIASNTLTCTASGGSVTFQSNAGASGFDVVFSATPQAAGTYQNPRSGGSAQIDPNNVVVESNESNNSPATNTVNVSKASTTTTITSHSPNPSEFGQALTVQWSVTVNSPGAVGAALSGNVTVGDGTDSCNAAVSAGQCDITFTSAGAKSLTANYAGDGNYNNSTSPSVSHTVLAPPTIAKSFTPSTIQVATNSTVTLTLSNSNGSVLTGGAFSDTLANMSATGGAVTGTCAGTAPNSLSAGSTALAFSGITIPANGSCTVVFSVTSTSVGVQPNTTSGVSTTQTPVAGSTSNTANLTVIAGDLTLTQVNDVIGSIVVGEPWTWALTATDTGAPVTFTAGQTILSDNLPNIDVIYGAPSVQNVSNIIGGANINCVIVSSDLTCTASGSVTFDTSGGPSHFDVLFTATPQAVGAYTNPRSGGSAEIDPANVVIESNESNNALAGDTVTVGQADTTTAIISHNPNPSEYGQALTVQWDVTVNAPGAAGLSLSGNVTVGDGTDSCSADVSAGQCNITFTSAGAKSLIATYAGDSNYNGSASAATPHTVLSAPTIAKGFAPTSIQLASTSAVTLTLSNSNGSPLTAAAFTDTLTNMTAVGGSVTGTCAGTTPNALAAGATALAFSGITVPASGSCTVIFSVTSNSMGTYPNTTSGVSATETPVAGAPSNTANLTVGDLIFANGFE